LEKTKVKSFDVFVVTEKGTFTKLLEGGLLRDGPKKLLIKLDVNSSETITKIIVQSSGYSFNRVAFNITSCKVDFALSD
jgi:hypothetical protein